MNRVKRYFRIASLVAQTGDKKNPRKFRLGAVGIRKDGIIVSSANVACSLPSPSAHAEARVCKKLTPDSEVFVVRILRDGSLNNARPCQNCILTMQMTGVKRCFYSISPSEYGVINFK